MLVYGVSAIFGGIIMLVKKTHVAGIVWGFAAGLNVILNIMLIPPFGILGPALATLFTFGFASLVIISYTRTHLVFRVDWSFIGKCVVAAVVMGAVLWLLLGLITYEILPTVGLIVLGLAIYFGMLYATRAIDEKEKEFLKSFTGSK
jgi:O-antigen/teichoic acid export membrane protein